MLEINLKGKKIDYTIRKSKQAKNLRISVKGNGKVVLSMPWYVPKMAGKQFLQTHEDWILKQLQGRAEKKKVFVSETKLGFLGQAFYELKFFEGKGKRSFLREHFRELHFFQGSVCTDLQAEIRLHLETFYREKARRYLKNRVQIFAEKLEVSINKIFIKNQQTRWGSCSGKGNLNFNWRIIFAPKEIVDYLVIHEVCHLQEMNHSVSFWELVELLDPKFKQHKKWLRKEGKQLDF
ncbi:M48 family metallopeptidase [Candidatus Gracilibacteria bacterium]|nr:M48 family metallopeptidase [Candidatus Gracilibacteria bacterium]